MSITRSFLLFSLLLLALIRGSSVMAEPAIKKSELNSTFLLFVKNGSTQAAKQLLAQGADVNARNKSGNTALFLASMTRKTDLVQLILGRGANINEKNEGNRTALDVAVNLGYVPIVKLLISKGADVNAQDFRGFTVLMTAVGMEVMARRLAADGYKLDPQHRAGLADVGPDPNATLIKLLLKHGARVNRQALEFAEGEPSIRKLLLQAQAKQAKPKRPRATRRTLNLSQPAPRLNHS